MASRVMLSNVIWKNVFILRSCLCSNNVIFDASNKLDIPLCRQYSTEPDKVEIESVEVDELEEQHIQELRNVSRLPEHIRNRMPHVLQPPKYSPDDRESDRWKFFPRQRFTKHERRLFAKYGRDSNVNPGVCWPSKQDLEELTSEEEIYEPTLKTLWSQMTASELRREESIKKKEAQIEANLAVMPKMLSAYRKRLQKEGEERREIDARQQKIKRDVLDHFGYNINRSDELYKEYRQQKAEEEKLARKSQSREAKAVKSEARLKAARAKLRQQLAEDAAKEVAAEAATEDTGRSEVKEETNQKTEPSS